MANLALVHSAWCWQRVRDPNFLGGHWKPGAQLVLMATGHDPMVSAPDELAQILMSCAR